MNGKFRWLLYLIPSIWVSLSLSCIEDQSNLNSWKHSKISNQVVTSNVNMTEQDVEKKDLEELGHLLFYCLDSVCIINRSQGEPLEDSVSIIHRNNAFYLYQNSQIISCGFKKIHDLKSLDDSYNLYPNNMYWLKNGILHTTINGVDLSFFAGRVISENKIDFKSDTLKIKFEESVYYRGEKGVPNVKIQGIESVQVDLNFLVGTDIQLNLKKEDSSKQNKIRGYFTFEKLTPELIEDTDSYGFIFNEL